MSSFENNIIDTIKKRKSVRSYSSAPIEPIVLDELLTYANNHATGPFGNKVRFKLVDAQGFDTSEMKSLGTYGVIHGAKTYLVGIIKPGPHCNEDFGFCMESAMLKATALRLGTCWLGGFLNRSTFAELCHIEPDDLIPAITPLGFAAVRTTLRDKLIRKAVDGNNRHPFSAHFYANDFATPLMEDDTNPLHTLLECVRVAPSASNKQPWRLLLSQGTIHLYLDEDYAYSRRFDPVLMQNIDMGIAMAHVALAANKLELNGKWTPLDSAPTHDKFIYIASWVKG
jgi:nitroreductase